MPTYPLMQVDAFTDHALGGNACAVVFEADAFDERTMLAVAREMNQSETAFVARSATADWRVRYFTPAEEVPLAGHPTIATVWALVASGRQPLTGDTTHLRLELRDGPIAIEVRAHSGKIARVIMTQRPPRFLARYEPADIMPVFGLDEADALPGVPIQTVSTGNPQLMVPLRDHAALRRVRVNVAAYEALRVEADFFSPHLFCLGGATPRGATFARHFGSPPDLPEDPVTGSATGGMAAYLWHFGLIDRPHFIAEQGHWMNRPGEVDVEVIGPREEIEAVRVGGSAVVVFRGELDLP